ncbi:MAG TPA: glycosyltransferase family 2 protein [Rubellimicrobium sp.]|nr:glycosyltransferase family 2 protein [Rubellimicrobium sp.]
MNTSPVAVLIAAHNAQATIGAAVRSALQSPLVAEVILVSDGSTDATAQVASQAAGPDERLRVLELPRNFGPAEARNRGISMARAEFVALLDADDEILPGRFEALLARRDWDLAADNILFASDPLAPLPSWALVPEGPPAFDVLTLAEFVRGNLTQPGRPRGELGFLKPVISRAFMDRAGLRYDPRLRLGEDYDFYVRAFLAGGRFLLTRRPGYLAHVRLNSLSARHSTTDLGALAEALRGHLATRGLGHKERHAMRSVLRQVAQRHALRAALDAKARGGVQGAIRTLLAHPLQITGVVADVVRDKLSWGQVKPSPQSPFRLLLPDSRGR